jgi:hypothetical protein
LARWLRSRVQIGSGWSGRSASRSRRLAYSVATVDVGGAVTRVARGRTASRRRRVAPGRGPAF